MNSFQLLLIHSPIGFIFANIHICMLIFTPQFDVFFFIYYAHAYLFTLVLFVYLLLKRVPRKIGYQPVGLPYQNKDIFTFWVIFFFSKWPLSELKKTLHVGETAAKMPFAAFLITCKTWLVTTSTSYINIFLVFMCALYQPSVECRQICQNWYIVAYFNKSELLLILFYT